jgi:sulfatase modifying factor 1
VTRSLRPPGLARPLVVTLALPLAMLAASPPAAAAGVPAPPALATGETHRVVVQASPTVRVPAGPFSMGSSSAQLSVASTLCAEEIGPRGTYLCAESGPMSRIALQRGPWPLPFGHERPHRRVWLSAFDIDRTEVTNAAWNQCVQAGRCPPAVRISGDRRFDGPDQPVVGISHDEAAGYCRWRGGRLPTEAEWEKAARGLDDRIWPWGDRFDSSRLNHGRLRDIERGPDTDITDGYRFTARVGSFRTGQSPYGALDMAGNVAEWVADWFDESHIPAASNPQGPPIGATRIVRGGSFLGPKNATRCAARTVMDPGARELWIGFRCARDAR